MVWDLDLIWLTLAVGTVGIAAFLLALCLDAIMGDDAFGAVGNTSIIMTGFFGALLSANWFGCALPDMQSAIVAGLAGALVTLSLLSTIKALANRL